MYKDIADMSMHELCAHFEHASRADLMVNIQRCRMRERAIERALEKTAKFLPPPPVVIERTESDTRALERLLRRKTDV